MARYNTSSSTNTITGAATISSPFQGAFTQFSGSAPYTVTLPAPAAFPGVNQTFYNATGGVVTVSTPSGAFTGTGGPNAATFAVNSGNVLTVVPDGTNYIVISEDGSPLVATTGSFSSNVSITGGTTSVTPTSFSLNPGGSGSNIENVNIGLTTRSTGAFTTLAANQAVTFTAGTSSSSSTTGTLVVTGGIGATGNIYSGASVFATNLTGTLQTASQTNITSVGTLTGLTTGSLTVNNFSILSNTAGINPDSYTNTVVAGGINFPSGWGVSSAIGGNAGTGDSWALGHNGGGLYFGMGDGVSNNTQQTYIQMQPNRNLFLVPTSGNVGIGTTSPAHKLQVAGSIYIEESGSNFLRFSNDGYKYIVSTTNIGDYLSIVNNPFASGIQFGKSTLNAPATFVPNMTLTTAGNLGIGVISPSGKLHVNLTGTVNAATTTITNMTNYDASSRMGFSGLANNNDGIYFGMGIDGGINAGMGFFREASGWNSALAFYTNNVTDGVNVSKMQEKMRLDSSGTLTFKGAAGTAGIAIPYNYDGSLSGTSPIFTGYNWKFLGTFTLRDGSRYLDIKFNYTSQSMFYIFKVEGYLYNQLLVNSMSGGYLYTGSSILNTQTVNSGNNSISVYKGTSTYSLCLKIDRGTSSYSEGSLNVYFESFDASTQNGIYVTAFAQNNTAGNYYT
jgi:hypothetical protein